MPPPRRVKLAFWLLLGLASAALAEVGSGSSPFVLFTPSGLLLTLPVYLLHAVFLAGVVYRYSGALRLGSLYLAGALFGLYEAYLTKVLWVPTWEPIPVRFGGVHVFETVLLVLFWHPLMAFVLPLLVVEALATPSRLVPAGVPPRVRRAVGSSRAILAGALVLGAFQGAVSTGATTAVGSAVATITALALALEAWRRRVGAHRYPIGELLPAGRELWALGALLAAMYLAYGVGLRPAQLPEISAQATVWGIYLVFGGLLLLRLRQDRNRPSRTVPGRAVRLRALVPQAGAYVVAVGIGSVLLRPVAGAAFVGLYVVAIGVGAATIGWIVLGLLRSHRAGELRGP